MKKSCIFGMLVLGLMGCQRHMEQNLAPERPLHEIVATVEDAETKTTLSPGENGVSSVLWSEGDALAVFIDGKNTSIKFTLREGAGTKKGVFKGDGKGSHYAAFYPAEMVSSLSGSAMQITLPAEQEYQAGTFAFGSYPMLATGNTANLQFYNLSSVLRLSLTGKHPVTRIVFRSAQPANKVCGPASVNTTDNVLSVSENGCDSLVLNVPGVQLNKQEATHFFLSLPPQTYKGGFTVRVYTGERFMDKSYTKDFTMKRSRLHKADAFAFKPNGVDASTTLEGAGTELEPFLIQSLGDLVLLQESVNSGASIKGKDAAAACYKLTADIDLSPVCGESLRKNWVPIGCDKHGFKGRFDGNNRIIYGLYINNSLSCQALFGVIEEDVSIIDLTISGTVSSTGNCVSLLSGKYINREKSYTSEKGIILNCSVEGSVSGKLYVGGLLGIVDGGSDGIGNYGMRMRACINRADVSGGDSVGGITGQSFFNGFYPGITGCANYGMINGRAFVGGISGRGSSTDNCTNYGSVSGVFDVGGIIGEHYDWFKNRLMNCQNKGAISGDNCIGGICGITDHQSIILNNVNRGAVLGKSLVGGICGMLRNGSSIRNCVNLGFVELVGEETSFGGIVGKSQGPNLVEQNYWLYDDSDNFGIEVGVGLNEGVSNNNYYLTYSQMQGAPHDTPLYQSYSAILDALNGWAYGNNRDVLQGWKTSPDDGYPVLSGDSVHKPGESRTVFSIDKYNIPLILADGEEFSIEVSSNLDYTVQLPSWISEVAIHGYETMPYIKKHVFRASANESGVCRNSVISFTNTEGAVLKVNVAQCQAYLSVASRQIKNSERETVCKFNLFSSLSWIISSDAAWCMVEPQNGRGDAVVSVWVSANENAKARTAMLTIASVDGTISHKLPVVQSGKKDEGGGQDDWKNLPFVHQSVGMRFTATWCGWCPRMNRSVKRAQELYPGKIQHLALHGGGSDLVFGGTSALMNQYFISGFPTGVVDGRSLIGNTSVETASQAIVNAVKETEETYGTVSGASILSSTSGRTANVNVEVFLKKAGQYKLTVLLLEDGIVNVQTDNEVGNNSRYVHDNVARMVLSDVQGDAFTTGQDFTTKSFSYSVSVPSGYNMNKMRVLVYIQRAFGSYPVRQSDSYGDYFIDNCATVELGENLKLALEGESGSGDDSGDGNEGITPGGDIDM